MESLNKKQNWYLQKSSEKWASELFQGVKAISTKSTQSKKYKKLLEACYKLEKLNVQPTVLYLQPINPDKFSFVISFKDVQEAINDPNDPIASRFCQSLEKWEDEAREEHNKKRVKPNFVNC